jgi:hypothetical protein
MALHTDWLPSGRGDQLAMARNWLIVIGHYQGPPWGISEGEIAELRTLTAAANGAFSQAKSSERNPAVTAACKAAFEGLIEKMQCIKSRYFISPPLTDTDFISLELKPCGTTLPMPTAQAEADISCPGVHLLLLHLRPVSGSSLDLYQSDYGYHIYWGVMPQGGATVEAAMSPKRELMQAPPIGSYLPNSRFTRRKNELFEFDAEDSGKTVYFCVRYENAKGDSGPWGPMFQAVIP